ncbi:ABC transporter permease subunit [Bacillus sp. H-16]|uniref:ABC transporter permease n=1 Tax=Alteribacter salitolerans TaxID=2912333 RepID=UPI0019648AA3|nr:ABC transporter permease subunit [Alteribacter salitolerans]MBM7096260.1 ABC transporter permease subunit [Alteribacter salitolerans]
MRQWTVLYKKELKEQWRSFKWLWVPLVFMLLGMMQPVTAFYLPEIMEQFGGLPEGAVFDIPLPGGGQVIAETLGQFSQIGTLILVLAFMGTIVNERVQGTWVMVLVKPVSYANFITAKWAGVATIVTVSYVLGLAAGIYYTVLLIESVPVGPVISGALIFLLWLLFLITLLLLFSSLFKSSAAVAFLTLGIAIVLSLISGVLPEFMEWSPGMLTSHSYEWLITGEPRDGLWLPVTVTAVLIACMISLSVYSVKRKEVISS